MAVMAELATRLENDPQDAELLWRLGFLHTMLYNLDWPDAKVKLEGYFKRLFDIDKENKFGHLYYGAHLTQASERVRPRLGTEP